MWMPDWLNSLQTFHMVVSYTPFINLQSLPPWISSTWGPISPDVFWIYSIPMPSLPSDLSTKHLIHELYDCGMGRTLYLEHGLSSAIVDWPPCCCADPLREGQHGAIRATVVYQLSGCEKQLMCHSFEVSLIAEMNNWYRPCLMVRSISIAWILIEPLMTGMFSSPQEPWRGWTEWHKAWKHTCLSLFIPHFFLTSFLPGLFRQIK